MKINRKKTYQIFYALSLLVLGGLFLVILGQSTARTYASEDEDVVASTSEEHYVTIYDGSESLTIKTDAITVIEALNRADIMVEDTDIVEPGRTDFINTDNFQINIYRSRPVVVSDGATRKFVMSASYDPRAIAEDAGITVYDGDKFELVEENSFLETGVAMSYKLVRNGGRIITEEKTIPFKEETRADANLESGKTKVIQVGEDGRKVVKYRVNFVDGVEKTRELVSETIVKQPVNRITAEGTKNSANNAPTTGSIRPEWSTCASYARQAGVSEGDLYAALTLIYHESGCRYNATNRYSGAYGIPQALPGHKMASAGSDWRTNPVTQIRWMIKYVNGRYGGWQGALSFWNAHKWY